MAALASATTAALTLRAPRVRLIETSSPNLRAPRELAELPAPAFEPALANLRDGWYGKPAFVVNTRAKHQTFLGFGGAFTESAAFTLGHLSDAQQDEVMRGYFDAAEGHGYVFGRTHINSCDFSLGNWACADVADDFELKHFSMERTARHVVPMIRRALRVFAASPASPAAPSLRLLASPWSPPAWMKTTGKMNEGGKLRPECRDAWANHYVKWVDAMAELCGCRVWGLTVQNEPAASQAWDSCEFTAEEERDFVRDHLGPALERAGLLAGGEGEGGAAAATDDGLKLIVWDHNRQDAFARGAAVYDDAAAARFVWGLGLHWYSGEFYDQTSQLQAAFPEKHVIFTEGCIERGPQLGRWDRGERYATHIIGDLNHGCEAWIDWNLCLNTAGGPNHAGNMCDAPVLIDTDARVVHYQSSYAYIGHFARFIRPGAVRVGLSRAGGPLEATCFVNTDGSLALVVHNPSEAAHEFRIVVDERGGLHSEIPAKSIQTYIIEDTKDELCPAA